MAANGLDVKTGQDITRLQITCEHQSGLLYMVPGEKSWVCSQEMMPAHALAGFLGELVEMEDSRVKAMMQRWGIYFRRLPLEETEDGEEGAG